MNEYIFLLGLLLLAVFGYYSGRKRANGFGKAEDNRKGDVSRKLHSVSQYHGLYIALWVGLPSFLLFLLWKIAAPYIMEGLLAKAIGGGVSEGERELILSKIYALARENISIGEQSELVVSLAQYYLALSDISAMALFVFMVALSLIGLKLSLTHLHLRFMARKKVEQIIGWIMIGASSVAVLTTIGIIFSLLFESLRFFAHVPIHEFLFGLQWSPQTAIRADQVANAGSFGAIAVFSGTLLITFIAMCVAVPIGLMSAIYLSEYASPKLRMVGKPLLEILAGVPTVVYGFFAVISVAPFLREMGAHLGWQLSSESALAAGLVMGIMIIPFISSLSDDVMNAVPQTLRDGAYALGATKAETIRKIIVPAALPGIIGSILLAISRAIGETMIVVMAAGLAANLTANPFEAVTTVTVQIVVLLVGDQEFDSAKTLAAFALGLVLFVLTLILNIIALAIVRKYKEQYE